jgi:hypothetical protein
MNLTKDNINHFVQEILTRKNAIIEYHEQQIQQQRNQIKHLLQECSKHSKSAMSTEQMLELCDKYADSEPKAENWSDFFKSECVHWTRKGKTLCLFDVVLLRDMHMKEPCLKKGSRVQSIEIDFEKCTLLVNVNESTYYESNLVIGYKDLVKFQG